MPKRNLIGLLVACALGAAACGGGTSRSQTDSTPSEAGDTASDSTAFAASRGPLSFLFSSSKVPDLDQDLVRDCQESFEQLESYRSRFETTIRYQYPELVAELERDRREDWKESRIDEWIAAGTPAADARKEADRKYTPREELLEPLQELGRFDEEVEYQAPDRWRIESVSEPGIFDVFAQPADEEAIVIGDTIWLKDRQDGAWELDEDRKFFSVPISGSELCDGVAEFTAASNVELSEDVLDGKASLYYRLDTEAVNVLFEPDGPKHKSAVMELWLEAETSLPLKFRFEGTADQPSGPDDELIGYNLGVDFEIYSMNDASIQIEPPIPAESSETAWQ